MKITKWVLIIGAGLFFTLRAQAQTRLSYDLFGIYTTRDRDGESDSELGLGAGFNYFFNSAMGIGADTYVDGVEWPYLLNVSFIYRFPELKPVSPYAFAGLGRQWAHAPQWLGHLGGGAEYTWSEGMAVFADARFVLPQDTDNHVVVRAGVRFGF